MEHFVYVLLSLKDGRWYIGQTDQAPYARLADHNEGKSEATKFRRPLELIYYERYLNKSDALGREKFLKSGSGHNYLKKQLQHFLKMQRGQSQKQ